MAKTQSSSETRHLLEFYGNECPHCIIMKPLVERFNKESKTKIVQHEVWHDKKNAALLQQYDTGLCGGVPFFFNKKTGKSICGSVSYEALKAWALGEKKKGILRRLFK